MGQEASTCRRSFNRIVTLKKAQVAINVDGYGIRTWWGIRKDDKGILKGERRINQQTLTESRIVRSRELSRKRGAELL